MTIARRTFLRAAGVALALPFLESVAHAATPPAAGAPPVPGAPPRRMLAICNNLGLLTDLFVPPDAGRDYTLSPYLSLLKDHRNDFTVFSGVSHPYVDGSHASEACFLTAAPRPGGGSFRNTISLDQVVAEHRGTLTRFPSLVLGVNTKRGLSWTGNGVAIPCEEKASEVFAQLFLQGTPAEVAAQVQRLDTGRSILDSVASQVKRLERQVSTYDRDRLDQYATSVRDLEGRMQAARAWETRPKPVVDAKPPVDPGGPAAFLEKTQVLYDLARLALETDSTRLVTLALDAANTPVVNIPGAKISEGYHNLSHHGKSDGKRSQLRAIEEAHVTQLGALFAALKNVREGDGTLLDHTMVLYGSNLGDANTHSTLNMPVLLAGGGFRHGQHLAFDKANNYPLPNLYLSMLHRLGVEVERFASSTGTMRGLEPT